MSSIWCGKYKMHSFSTKTFIFKHLFKDVSCLSNSLSVRNGTTQSFSTLSESFIQNGKRILLVGRFRRLSYSSMKLRTFHFDTHSFVTKLEGNGYTKQQAEIMTTCLLDVLNSCMKNIEDTHASKIDQERLEMKLQTSINENKKEMFLLEQSKFAKIKEENERLKEKAKALENLLRDEVSKLKSSTKLDLSLEKSMTREELALRDQRIKDNANKIETEIAKLGTLMETQKLDLIKYLVGSLISLTTVGLAFWRFLKM